MSLPRALSAVAVVAVLALTGCTPGETLTDDSAPSPSSTKPVVEVSEEPAVNISSIVIDGDSVYVTEQEGGVILDIPYTTDPVTAAEQLSATIGLESTTAVTPPASCGGDLTRTTWGGITFVSPYAAAPGGAQFYATADAEKTTNGITVAMLGGQWVGYDGPSTIAAYPGSTLDFGMDSIGVQVIAYDVKSGSVEEGNPDTFYGGIAVIKDNKVESFSAPIHYWYDC